MNTKPAEIFAPGDFIKDEIDCRNWTPQDLANAARLPIEVINGLLDSSLCITQENAKGLASAFGTSVELWTAMDARYHSK